MAAIVGGCAVAGFLYLGSAELATSVVRAQLMLPVFLTIALYNGAYSMRALTDAIYGVGRVLGALAVAAGVLMFFTFSTRTSQQFSRVSSIGGLVAAALFLIWARLQMRRFVRARCGAGVFNELVIDDDGPSVDLPGAVVVRARAFALTPALDDPHALHRIGLVMRNADRVVISSPPARRAAWAAILRGANVAGEVIDETVALLAARGARAVGGQGLLLVSVGPLGMRARAAKRAFDLAVAGLATLLLAPLMLLVALAIKLEDGGPVFFVQRRVGRGNRFFRMWKFRSMTVNRAGIDGAVSTARDDGRVTRVGAFIRKTSIDELPQLFNVLLGDMSLVGPRPHAIASQAGDKLFWEIDARYWERHALRPGLTGLAQVRGLRGATVQESDLTGRLNADLEYLIGWSLWRDIGIILATFRVVTHDQAY
ncbi:MAG: sugar transferase [Proteobacteria bacterium]|nr:sugar transferase [Pseudomonadota bacterium]